MSHCPEIDTRWTHEYGLLNLMVPNLVTRQSSAEASTMPTEGHMMATSEPHMKATRRCEFLLRSLPAGHTNATLWLYNVVLRVRCVRTRSRRRRMIFRWYKNFGRPWEIQFLIGDYELLTPLLCRIAQDWLRKMF